jgi:hypothetical protein
LTWSSSAGPAGATVDGTVDDKEKEVFVLSTSFADEGFSSVFVVAVDPPNEKPTDGEDAGGLVSPAGFAPKEKPDFSSGLLPAVADDLSPPKPNPLTEEDNEGAVPLLSPDDAVEAKPKPEEAGAEFPVLVEKPKPPGLLSLGSLVSLGAEESENPVDGVAEEPNREIRKR